MVESKAADTVHATERSVRTVVADLRGRRVVEERQEDPSEGAHDERCDGDLSEQQRPRIRDHALPPARQAIHYLCVSIS